MCNTCFDTKTIDQGGHEIACPECTPIEWTVFTAWAKEDGKEFERTRTYRALTAAEAMDKASADLPRSCDTIIDQQIV